MPRATRTFAEEAIATKRGEIPADQAKPEIRDAAARMSEKELKDLTKQPVHDLNKYGKMRR